MKEEIMDKLIARIRDKKQSLVKWDGEVAPRIRIKVNEKIELSRHCRMVWDGECNFKVRDYKIDKIHVVDFKENTCSCGAWQLSGIPCQHVACCANDRGRKVEEFVSDYYKIDKYLAAYGTPLECTRGSDMWDDIEGEKPEPPVMKRRPGRPRKNKMKPKGGEIKKTKVKGARVEVWSGHGRVMHCSECGGEEHNKRGCPKKGQSNSTNTAGESQMGSNGQEHFTPSQRSNVNVQANTTENHGKETKGVRRKQPEPSEKSKARKEIDFNASSSSTMPKSAKKPPKVSKKPATTKKPWK